MDSESELEEYSGQTGEIWIQICLWMKEIEPRATQHLDYLNLARNSGIEESSSDAHTSLTFFRDDVHYLLIVGRKIHTSD